MITTLLWIFGVMSLLGGACTVYYSMSLSTAQLARTGDDRSPHSSMAETHDKSPEDKRIDGLKYATRLLTVMTGVDVFVFFCLLVAKFLQ